MRGPTALVLLCCVLLLSSAEEAAAGADEEPPNFKKMRVKELKQLLKERGVQCKGCSEKSHFVQKVEETIDMPVLPPPAPPPAPPPEDIDLSKMGNIPGMDPKAMERMMKEMKGDFSHIKNPRRRKALEKLKKTGMSVSGVSDMDIEQLENLANMMGNIPPPPPPPSQEEQNDEDDDRDL